ncbi:unnamed protein product [Calypogeia fissa]
MDAGRLQGLAVARSCNLSCCSPGHEHQLQLVPSAGRLKSSLTPGFALHHHHHNHGRGGAGKQRGGKSTVIRAAIPHDLAAVAVAAATVLPMCWLYINRSQFSTSSASRSVPSSSTAFTVTTHEKKSSTAAGSAAASSTIVAATATAIAEIGPSLSTIHYANGAANTEEIDSVVDTRVQTRSSLERVVEDEWLAAYHETLVASVALVDEGEIGSCEGPRNSVSVAPSPSISWFEQNVHDSASRPGEPAYTELTGSFHQGWNSHVSSNVDDEPDVNEHRSNSGSHASTPDTTRGKVNGHRVEGAHMNPAMVDVEGLENLLPSGRDEFGSTDMTNTLGNSHHTLSPNSTFGTSAVKVNGTSFTLIPELDNSPVAEDDANLVNEISQNGALNGSSKSRPEAQGISVDNLILDDRLEESDFGADEEPANLVVDEDDRKNAAHSVRINGSSQPIPVEDRTNIDEKRTELAKIIRSLSQKDIEDFSGKVNGRSHPKSLLLDSAETAVSEPISSTKLYPRAPQSLSDILPLNVSAGSVFYLKIYEKLLRAGRVRDSIALLEEMDKLKIFDSDKVYHANFFKACQQQNAVKEAFRFMRLLSRPTLSSYNMLLSVCRDARDVDGGLRVLSAAENAGLKPDGILYTTLISTCAKAGNVEIAFKVYHDMETAGLKPTIETYGAMIDGCARAGQIAKAFGVYGIMISKKLKPDHVIFNTLINACGRAGAIERAFDVLADMRGEPFYLVPNHVTICALISACARAGQVDQAFEVYRNIRQWRVKATPDCYTAAVHACSATGDLDTAFSIFEEMKTDGVKPDEIFFSALIDVAGHCQQVDTAFSIMDDMKKVSVIPGGVTFSALMGVCCNTGNWERGLELYRNVRAANFRPTVSTFNALITALCDAKQIEQSFSIFQEMKEAGVQPDQITYSILLDACEKLDEPERAFDLYTSGRTEGVVPNEAMCASVIAICYARIKKKHRSTSYPTTSIGLLAGQTIEAPYEQWASWAVAVYRHAVAANVVPTIKSLSLLLGCLRIPEVSHEKSYLSDDAFYFPGHLRGLRPSSPSLSHMEGAGFYDARALALFEEAASMGVVPSINYRAGPITVNAQFMPSYVAEVYLISLLKGLKQRHNDGQQLFPVTIYYSTETKRRVTSTANKLREITITGRTGQGVAALLRRLRLHFHGHESSGKLKIDTASIRNWLKPTTAFQPLQRHQELGPFGPPHTFLGQGIAEQQRNIRMAEVYKNSADIERVSGVDMYRNRRRISQGNSWGRGESNDFDFTKNVDGSSKRASRRGTQDKRRP